MSTNKYKWLTLGLASVVISGCAIGSKPNLNLGIADAFRKSKNSLLKKKLAYGEPTANSNFGYASPANVSVATSLPCENCSAALSDATLLPDQLSSDCNCSNGVSGSETKIHLDQEMLEPTVASDNGVVFPAAILPFDDSQDNLKLENPLPDAVGTPDTSSTNSDSTEEEGIIDTLDSASIAPQEAEEVIEEMDEDLDISSKEDEASILDTAVMPLETETPTPDGESVVGQRSKMLTLTARPTQSYQASVTQRSLKRSPKGQTELQQVTHKRHFRQQNTLRPIHQKFRSESFEHTAEAPGPIKFKSLPLLQKESPSGKTSETHTKAPALNRISNSESWEQSATKIQQLPNREPESKSEAKEESVIKMARLPILKADSTSSAAIGSLRNFTNIRDLDPGFDKEYYSRRNAEAPRAAQVIAEKVSGASDDLLIER